jgi:hypothetical protein
MNAIFLFNQMRPIRSVHCDGCWTPETLRDQAVPALANSFAALDRSQDVFSLDPV